MKYLKEYKEFHDRGWFPAGTFVDRDVHAIKMLIKETDSKTLLDYGCGKAIKYRKIDAAKFYGVEKIFLYDPAYDMFDELIDHNVDIVICTDVMEHVPEEEVYGTLKTIISKADKAVFFSIACYPASKKMDDGTNLHVTIKDPDWWDSQIESAVEELNKDILTDVNFFTK